MKKILTLTLALVMLCSTVLGLASCGMEDDGAIINAYYVGELYDFDPARAVLDDDAMRVMSLLYEPLFTLDSKGRVKNALADDYEIFRDEENNEYRMEITLKDTMWSDSMKGAVKASDVVYAWKRILEPDFATQAAPLLYAIKNAKEAKSAALDASGHPITTEDIGAAAVNETTISITFRTMYDADGKVVEPDYDAFLRNLTSVALAPVCQQVVSAAEDSWAHRDYTIVTNGPFKIGKLQRRFNQFTIERNPYYEYSYEEKDEVAEANPTAHVRPYQITTDWGLSAEQMADMFANRSLFIMSEMPLSLRTEMKDDIEANNTLSTMSVLLNTSKADSPLASKVVRKTLSSVLDRKAIADTLVFATPATGFVSGGVFNADSRRDTFREEGGVLISSDVAQGDSGFAASQNIPTLKRTLTLGHNDSEADLAVAELVKAAWESLGFKVKLEALSYQSVSDDTGTSTSSADAYDKSNLVEAYYNGFDFGGNVGALDAMLVDYQMLSPDPFVSLCGFSSTLNGNGVTGLNTANEKMLAHVSGFANAEYDALIDKAYAENDLDKRAEYLHEAETILIEEMPIIPLTFGQCHYLASSKIKNVDVGYYGYPILTKTKLKNYKKYLPVEETPEAE